jgi:hypothetical protein
MHTTNIEKELGKKPTEICAGSTRTLAKRTTIRKENEIKIFITGKKNLLPFLFSLFLFDF